MSSAATPRMSVTDSRARADISPATTTSSGSGTSVIAMIFFASSARPASASDLPTGKPFASRKVFRMPPPTISRSTFPASATRSGELGRHLGARDDRHQRPRRMRERGAERVELRGHQRPRAGDLGEFRHAVRRRLGPVRGAESVVHVDVAQRRDLPRKRLVVRLLADVEAAVLQQHDFAGRDLDAVQPVLAQRDRASRAAPKGASRSARANPSHRTCLPSGAPGARSPSPRRPCRARAGCRGPRRGCACRR